MPDGPSVEIRVTADTSGLDQVTTQAQRLAAELQRTGGDTRKVNADFVEFGRRAQAAADGLNAASNAARQAGSALAASSAGAEQAAAGLTKMKVNAGEVREAVVLLHEVLMGRFDRMSGSVLVMVERMGGLGRVVGALQGPFGAAVISAAALGATFVVLARQAAEAAAEIRAVSAAAALQGRDVNASVASAQRWGEAMSTSGMMGRQSARTVADAIAEIPNVTYEVREKLAAIGEPLTRQLGGDAKKAAELISHSFDSISGLEHFADVNNLMTRAQVEALAEQKGVTQAYIAVLDQAQGRLSGYWRAAKQAEADAATAMTGAAAAGGAAIPITPAMMFPLQFPQGTRGPTPLQREATDRALAAKGTGAPNENEQLRARMADAENVAAAHATNLKNLHQDELKADIGVLQQELLNEKLTATERLAVEADLARKKAELMAADLRGGGRGGGRAPSATAARGGGAEARSEYADFAAGERDKIAAAQGNSAQIQSIYQEWAARAKAQFGDTSREYANVMRQMTETAQREAKEQARAIAEASRQAYEQFAGAERDKIAAADGATAKILAIYQQWADRAKAVFGQQSKEYEAAVKQMTDATNRAAEQMRESFAKPFDTLGSSFEGAVTGLLTHQTTAGKAEQEAYRSLVGSGVHELGGALSTSLGGVISPGTKSLGDALLARIGIGKPGGLFGTGIGAVSGATAETTQATLTTAVTANTAAITANTAALTTSAGASVGGGALSLGSAAGGIGGFITGIPVIGGFLGSLFGGGGDQDFSGGVLGFAHGGIMPRISASPNYRISASPNYRIPSYAGGGIAIPGLAKLHENEMVLDSRVSNFVQNASAAYAGGAHGGAGGDMSFHMHNEGATILDGPSFHRWFQSNGKQMINDMIKNSLRSNALTPRTI